MSTKGTTKLSITTKGELAEKWYLMDAKGQRIGRFSSKVAQLLLGKNDPKLAAARHLVPKIKVIVINAKELEIDERKAASKTYTRYSGFPSGLTTVTLQHNIDKFPERIIENAVKGMLPKNRRGNAIYSNLFVFAGSEHNHSAQKPELVK